MTAIFFPQIIDKFYTRKNGSEAFWENTMAISITIAIVRHLFEASLNAIITEQQCFMLFSGLRIGLTRMCWNEHFALCVRLVLVKFSFNNL